MTNIKIYKNRAMLPLTLPEKLTFQMFDLQKIGHGHGVQFSVVNVVTFSFAATLTISEKIAFQICHLNKVSQVHRVQYSQ